MATITPYEPNTPSDALHAIWQSTLGTNPAYTLPPAKLHALLNYPTARVFLASSGGEAIGWALTYTIRAGCAPDPKAQHLRGGLSAIVVHPDHQRRGFGSALHAAALDYLEDAVRGSFGRSTPPARAGEIQLGSAFPRIFPGVPDTLPALDFFGARGWTLRERATDLYGRLPTSVDLTRFTAPAEARGVVFRPATPADGDALMALEYAEFGGYCGWPDLFAVLLSAGRTADIHLAVREGRIIGATVAAMPGSPAHERLAWPDVLGESPRGRLTAGTACAAIACVGVSAGARGTGAGVGLTAAAMLELTRRGADGVFIDWVAMLGFYERFGVRGWEAPYVTATRVVT